MKTDTGGPAITPYQIMMILSTEVDGEQHAEAISRVRSLVEDAGGTVDDVAEWGRRKIAYPVRKQADGELEFEPLELHRTLAECGLVDEREAYEEHSLAASFYVHVLHVYWNDDLTEA